MAAGAGINNDMLWLELGNTFCSLKKRYWHIAYHIIQQCYPKTNTMATTAHSIMAIDFRDLASVLDSMVSIYYPRTVHEIIVEDIKVYIINVFYNYPIGPIEITDNTYPYKPYQKALYENDILYIQEFMRDMRQFIIRITNMPLIMNNRKTNELKQVITKFTKRIGKLEEMIRDADIKLI